MPVQIVIIVERGLWRSGPQDAVGVGGQPSPKIIKGEGKRCVHVCLCSRKTGSERCAAYSLAKRNTIGAPLAWSPACGRRAGSAQASRSRMISPWTSVSRMSRPRVHMRNRRLYVQSQNAVPICTPALPWMIAGHGLAVAPRPPVAAYADPVACSRKPKIPAAGRPSNC